MSKHYRATVLADKWPYPVTVEASNWHVAAARAVTAWEKRFKGSHTTKLTVTIVKEAA